MSLFACFIHRQRWSPLLLLAWSELARGLNGTSTASDTDADTTEYDTTSSLKQPQTTLGFILPVAVILLVVMILIAALISVCRTCCLSAGEENEPEEQQNLILCHEDNAKFEYNLILRVGCPTPNFDMKKAYIDFDILGHDDEIMGNPVRFDCSLLKDRICGEMHCLIGSIAPLATITGIRISHGEQSGTIFLYEYVLLNLPDDSIREVRRFNTYITNKHVIYRGVSCNADDETEVGLFPDLPMVELTKVEAILLISLTIMVAGSLVMLFEYFSWYPFNADQDGSMVRSLFDWLFVSPITIAILGAITLIFKYYIKRNLLQHEYSINESDTEHWRCMSHAYLGIITALTLALSAVLICFSVNQSFIKSLYWFSSTLIVTVCTVGTWEALNKWLWFKSLFEKEVHAHGAELLDGKKSLAKRVFASHSRSQSKQRRDQTVFFTKETSKSSKGTSMPKASSSNFLFGPKLVNPKIFKLSMQKQKDTKKKNKKSSALPKSGRGSKSQKSAKSNKSSGAPTKSKRSTKSKKNKSANPSSKQNSARPLARSIRSPVK